MPNATTIKVYEETKDQLDNYRQYKNESYDEILRKLLYAIKNIMKKPKLSRQTILEIEEARKRIKAGDFYTEEEARKALGL